MVKMDRITGLEMGRGRRTEYIEEIAPDIDNELLPAKKLFYFLAYECRYGEEPILRYIKEETDIMPAVVKDWFKEGGRAISSSLRQQIFNCLKRLKETGGGLTPLPQSKLQSKRNQVLEPEPDDLNRREKRERLGIIISGFPTEAEEHEGIRLTAGLGQILFLMNRGETDKEMARLLEVDKENLKTQKNLLFRTILGRPRKRGKQTDPIDLKEIIQKAKELGFLGEKVPSADSK